jgi:quinol---cytochrome c reductase iron-sulfur subunit
LSGGDDRGGNRMERRAAVAFCLTMVAALSLAAVYLQGGQPQAEGALLALALGGLAYGIVTWAHTAMPFEPVTGKRDELASEEPERRAFVADLEAGKEQIGRRKLLGRLLAAALGALGVAALFPVRSLGPSPGRSLLRTAWRRGSRLVTADGRLVRAGDLEVGGVLTVFPEGHAGRADSQTLLIRVDPGRFRPRPGRSDWAPGGHVAYSKICTHAGCPVGLYEATSHQLLCPCHQSTFDVLDGARPIFGPATRSLPQLPLAEAEDGFLRAQGDYEEPVGPGFWERA